MEEVREAYIGDGTTTDYTVEYGPSYYSGSLDIHVSGLDWNRQVTETNPLTGEYSLAYPPPLGSSVRAVYVAHP